MLADRKFCTACTACYAICKFNAIKMLQDENGFIYPEIDDKKCVNCGQCVKVCPVINYTPLSVQEKYYMAWNLDESIRYNSSSGGVMSAIAEIYLRDGWFLFGAVWDSEKKKLRIEYATDENYTRQRKSKYVEADVGDAYKQVAKFLNEGEKVVYVGTPCQISGLRKIIGDTPNIIYIDFICHGTPSSGLFSKHINNLEKKYGKKIEELNFRCKSLGWMDYVLELYFQDKKVKRIHHSLDSFYSAFLNNYILRENCYFCKWRQGFEGDITIGDFWGINEYKPELNDDKGISIVCVKGKRGAEVFEKIKQLLSWEEIPIESAQYIYNGQMEASLYKSRNAFLQRVQNVGFERAAKETYMKNVWMCRLKYVIKRVLRKLKISFR